MTSDESIDELITRVATMSRDEVVTALKSFREPALDFDEAYLRSQSLETLRHVLLAACMRVSS